MRLEKWNTGGPLLKFDTILSMNISHILVLRKMSYLPLGMNFAHYLDYVKQDRVM